MAWVARAALAARADAVEVTAGEAVVGEEAAAGGSASSPATPGMQTFAATAVTKLLPCCVPMVQVHTYTYGLPARTRTRRSER